MGEEQWVNEMFEKVRIATEGSDTASYFENGEPLPNMKSISFVGKEIDITNPAVFAEIAASASNIEIYRKSNGTMQLDITFYN